MPELPHPGPTRIVPEPRPAGATWETTPPGPGPAPAPAPPSLGGYLLLEPIGEGGMGVVYRAEDTRLGRLVAVKVMRPEMAARPEARRRFLREGKALAKVEHQHIVPVLAADEQDGVPFLVMPLLRGQTLAQRLAAGKPPLPEALRIARQAAEAIAAAHAAGLIHRDIKPSNLWLDEDGRVRLMDFGLAREVGGAEETASGAVLGTPAFMAPEQARGERVDAGADLYSFGLVLKAVSPDPALAPLTAALLAEDPARRPASAAVADELRRLEGTLAAPRRMLWPLAGLALAALAVLAFFLWPRGGTPEQGPPDKGPPVRPTGFPPLPEGWADALRGKGRLAQMAAVRLEMMHRNPGFDGTISHDTWGPANEFLMIQITSPDIADLTPVAALPGLTHVGCYGTFARHGRLVSLEPLRGLKLTQAGFSYNPIRDLSPLEGMPLRKLWLSDIDADDFTPVYGLGLLERLHVSSTRPGARLDVGRLLAMPLVDVWFEPAQAPGLSRLKAITTLKKINGRPPALWKD